MKVSNETRYSTRELRSIISTIYADLRQSEGALRLWKLTTISVVYGRSGYSGHASLGGTRAKLRLPRGKLDIRHFALVVDHELHHLYGFGHDKFSCSSHDRRPHSLWDYVVEKHGASLTEQATKAGKPKPTREERYATKLAALRSRIAKRERRISIDQRAVRRLTTKLRGMEWRAGRAAAEGSSDQTSRGTIEA